MPFIPQNVETWKPDGCLDKQHNPPSHIVLAPGTHVWQCPMCGHKTTIVVP